MNPQRGVVVRQSMSGSLLSLRDRLLEERARVELALKNPGAVVIPLTLTAGSGINGQLDDIVDLPSAEPKAAPTELMARGQLAMQFKLETKRETIEAVGHNYTKQSLPAAWFTNAPAELPNLASKDQLTLIRQFAASRSLSMVVKSGVSPPLSIPPSQLLLKPKAVSSVSASITPRLASTSLTAIPPRSSQLLESVTNRNPSAVSSAARQSLLNASQSLSSPDISATIAGSSSRKLKFSEYTDDDEVRSIDSDDAFNDDLIPDRSGSSTPPLPTLASEAVANGKFFVPLGLRGFNANDLDLSLED